MDGIKRKISEEFDERGAGNFSAALRAEIESSGDLKEYADDLIRVEGALHSLRDAKVADPDWKNLQESISQSIGSGAGEVSEALLSAPLPDGKEDQAMAGDEAKPSPEAAKPAADKPEAAKPAAAKKDDDRDAGRMRLAASKQPADKKESSGLINLGALVQEHRKSMVAPPPGGGLDVPPTVLGTDQAAGAGKGKGWLMPVAIGVGAVAVIAVVAVVGVTKFGKPAQEESQGTAEVDRKALEEKIKQEILAQLKAEGKIGAEAEAEAQAQAAMLAKAEIEKAATESTEPGSTGVTPHAKKKKKEGAAEPAGGVAAPEPAKETTAPAPKKGGAAEAGSKKPATAEDDLLGLLEGAAAKKPSEGSVLSGTPAKAQPPAAEKPAPTPTPTVAPSPAPAGGVPKTLSKEDISKSMNKIKPKILQCGEGKIGTLMLSLVVNSDGTVKSAKVTGKFATDPAGVCAENVAKTAKFPPFSNPTASVTYPFVFAPKAGE